MDQGRLAPLHDTHPEVEVHHLANSGALGEGQSDAEADEEGAGDPGAPPG